MSSFLISLFTSTLCSSSKVGTLRKTFVKLIHHRLQKTKLNLLLLITVEILKDRSIMTPNQT